MGEARMGEARIILYGGQPTFDLEVLRNDAFLAEFRAAVPYPHSIWHPRLKVWRVDREYLEVTKKIAAEYFEYVSETQG